MPRLQRLAQFKLDALVIDLAAERKAELGLRFVPVGAKWIAVRLEISEDAEKILPHEMRQHEAVVQRGAPARQRPIERIAP